MGRIEKKFQKKKERERAVRKKILAKRAFSREFTKDEKKKQMLERETSKKNIPIRRASPELKKTLEFLKQLEEKNPDVDSTSDTLPDETVAKVCGTKSSEVLQTSDGK